MPQMDSSQTNGLKKLPWGGKEIQLLKLLGAGLTADVYQAVVNEKDAAVKVLKPGSSAEVKNFFLTEMNNITEVRKAWAARYPGISHVVPELIGGEKEGETPFIIMDLVKGKPIDNELQEKGIFPESVGLHLFSQFGMLLVVLHERLKKYYADIKIDNLWKLAKTDASGNPLLIVTDWNVLNEFTEEGKIRDLFFTSLYLFQILTGASLPYKHGQVTVKLDSIAEFNNLSYGTREFLRKALNINVNRRFSTAQSWTDALDDLKTNWEKEATELNKMAAKYLDIAQEKQASRNIAEAADAYQKARMLLDISGLKGRGVAVVFIELSKKIDKGFESTSHREKGLISLRGGLYKEAAEIFDEGADLSVLNPELLRRFYWLSRGADEIGRLIFGNVVEEAITAVDKLVKGETVQSQSIFEEIIAKVSPASSDCLTHLLNESKILNLADDANRLREAGDFSGVVAAYQAAYNLFKLLPERPTTNWAEKLGDIKFLLQGAVTDEKTLGISRDCCQKAIDAYGRNEIELAASEFARAFSASPDDEYSLNQLKKCISNSLSEGKWMDSSSLIDRVIGLGDLKDKIKNYWEITTRLHRITAAFKRMRFDEGLQEISSYLTSFTGNEIAMGLSLKNVLQIALETSLGNENIETATKIIQTAAQINPLWGSEFKENLQSFKKEMSERVEDVVPHLLLNIYDLHNQNTLESSTKALELIVRLKAVLPDSDSRKEDVLKIEKIVETRKKLLQESLIDANKISEDTIQYLKRTIAEIEDSIEVKFNLMSKLSLDNADERATRTGLLEEISQQALLGVKAAASWQRMQPDYAEPSEKVRKFNAVITKTGVQNWTKIAEMAKNAATQYDQYRNSFLSAYQSGNIEEAQQLLDEQEALVGDVDEVYADKLTLSSTRQMLTWAASLSIPEDGTEISAKFVQVQNRTERDVLLAEEFLNQPIHPAYWKKAAINDHFNRQCMEFLRAFSNGFQNHSLDFVKLEKALLCNQVNRKINKLSGSEKSEKLDGSIDNLLPVMSSIEKLYTCKDPKRQIRFMLGIRKAFDQVTLKKQFTTDDFITAHQEYRVRMEKKRKNNKTLGILGLVLGGVVVLAAIGWVIFKYAITPKLNPEVTPTMAATITPTPENTPTSTPTIEPTEVVSKFKTSAEIPGFDPTGYGELFVIDDTDADIEGGAEDAWHTSTEAGIGQSFKYIDQLTPEETLTITWTMDMGLRNSGIYEIAVNETSVHSLLNSGITMQVMADDIEVKPLVGSGVLKFGSDPDQQTDAWRTLGIYRFAADQVITVKMTATGINLLTDQNELGVDAVLLAEQKTLNATDYSFLGTLPGSLLPVSMADYSAATFSNPADPWEPVAPQGNLSGEGYQISLTTLTAEPEITIPFPQSVLGPGRYHLYALISDKLSIDATYTVYVDEESVGTYKALADVGMKGKFIEILTFDLTEGKHTITIKVSPTNFVANQDAILGTNSIILCIDTAITIN